MINILLQAVAVIATATAWVPQTLRSLHSKDRSGISVSSWALGVGTGLIFALYGIRSHVWSLTLSEGAFAIGAVVLVATIVNRQRLLVAVVLATGLSVVVVLTCPGVLIGIFGIIGALGMRLLQIHRTYKSKSVAGMSSGSWVLLGLNVLAWGIYGLRTNHWPLVVTSALALLAAVVVLVVARHFRLKEDVALEML